MAEKRQRPTPGVSFKRELTVQTYSDIRKLTRVKKKIPARSAQELEQERSYKTASFRKQKLAY